MNTVFLWKIPGSIPSAYSLLPSLEYCVVVRSESLQYQVWISQMNEFDVAGSNRVVSKQPTLGVLFKSQNNKST